MVTMSFKTKTKEWTKEFDSAEAADQYRKFAFAKWRAISVPSSPEKPAARPVAAKKPVGCEAASLLQTAHQAGLKAATACTPVPMIVEQRANVMDDRSPVVHEYKPVMGGVCGFAWVMIKPSNCKVAKLLIEQGKGRRCSDGGVMVSIWDFNQSYERKLAYAVAYASVLQEADIKAYPEGRLD